MHISLPDPLLKRGCLFSTKACITLSTTRRIQYSPFKDSAFLLPAHSAVLLLEIHPTRTVSWNEEFDILISSSLGIHWARRCTFHYEWFTILCKSSVS